MMEKETKRKIESILWEMISITLNVPYEAKYETEDKVKYLAETIYDLTNQTQ